MSSCISLCFVFEHGLSGVLMVMIFEGVAAGDATTYWLHKPELLHGLGLLKVPGDMQDVGCGVKAVGLTLVAGVVTPTGCHCAQEPPEIGLPPPRLEVPLQDPNGGTGICVNVSGEPMCGRAGRPEGGDNDQRSGGGNGNADEEDACGGPSRGKRPDGGDSGVEAAACGVPLSQSLGLLPPKDRRCVILLAGVLWK